MRLEELLSTLSGNKLQLRSPKRYNSKLLASILSITVSKTVKRSEDECGGLYQVDKGIGVDRGFLISIVRHSNLILVGT